MYLQWKISNEDTFYLLIYVNATKMGMEFSLKCKGG